MRIQDKRLAEGWRARLAAWLALALACALASASALTAPAQAQNPPPPPLEDPVGDKKLELKSVEDTLGVSAAHRKKIEMEVAAIGVDRARLNEALMEATARVGAADARLADVERRLDTLAGSQDGIRRSLDGRRALVGEILGVLQRMGRRTPPALLANPEDVLQAIRTSMQLGAVLPELRAETQALAADLQELKNVRAGMAVERERLALEQRGLGEERTRLAALFETRQKALGEAQSALDAERRRAEDLARQAGSLKDLIARMEADLSGAQRAADEARKAEDARRQTAALETEEQKARIAASPFKDTARLAPAVAFAATRGRAPMPVNGQILKAFGDNDAFGGAEKGMSIAARPKSVVVSPADGWVAFAAPYRGYGQLLILNAGEGYYVVLAGMERIHVAHGQFVLAGEPVATMGEGATRAASTAAIGASQPILYVEFRKDGSPIDPSPWWARGDVKKVRG